MQDLTRRSFKTWAIAELCYALLLATLVVVFVPWKTPLANVLALLYCALSLAAAPALWRLSRWGWRLAVLGGLLGLLAAVLVCGGLLLSWAYLRTVFGDFGEGASLGALMFASVAAQLLGLYPALKLHALLRREVRNDLGGARALLALIGGLLALPLLLSLGVMLRFQVWDRLPAVPEEGRQQAVVYLRAALEGGAQTELGALQDLPLGVGPLVVTLWMDGKKMLRVYGEGEDLAAAVRDAADDLPPHLKRIDLSAARLKLDRLTASAPVASELPFVLALSVNPGIDGLWRRGNYEKALLADDLIKAQIFGRTALVPGIREIRLGLDTTWVLQRLAGEGRLERLRSEGWVEHGPQAVAVLRGNTPPREEERDQAYMRSALAAGDYIMQQLQPDGRFRYQHYPYRGTPRKLGKRYSVARHAGTVYTLCMLYGATEEPHYLQGAHAGADWLASQSRGDCGAPGAVCTAVNSRPGTGTSALSAIGMLDCQRHTGDTRFEAHARKLVDFVLAMQKDNGDFFHIYDFDTGQADPAVREMFASEEAALALVTAHGVLGDARYLQAAERALDFLTGPKYEGCFLDRFVYGADVWTCIAAHEVWPHLKSPRYLDFCAGYSRFMRRIQYQPGWWDNADFAGHYGFGALMVPQAPAAAGFTEAVTSAWHLSELHGRPDPALKRQAELALDALVRDQVREENSWMMPDAENSYGGFRRSLVEQEIRIDFVQHALSSLLRGVGM